MKNLLTATKIATELGSKAQVVNVALIELHFMSKVSTGYESNHRFGETRTATNDSTYVVWDEDILNDVNFVNKVKGLKEQGEQSKPTNLTTNYVSSGKFLSATEIAKKLKVKPAQVNMTLINIHYMDKLGKGYCSNHAYAKQLMHENGSEKTPYVKWSEDLLSDAVFLREIDIVKGVKEDFKKEVKLSKTEAPAPVESTKEESKEPFKFDRKTFDAGFRTQSGHFVRSRAEVIVADWLYNNDIMFAYEKRLPIVEELYSDFFIKHKKIYIEVWGLESTKYLERKEKKIAMYEEHGYTLIGLEDSDIENLDDFLPLKLAQAGFQF